MCILTLLELNLNVNFQVLIIVHTYSFSYENKYPSTKPWLKQELLTIFNNCDESKTLKKIYHMLCNVKSTVRVSNISMKIVNQY